MFNQGDPNSLEGVRRMLNDFDRFKSLHPNLTDDEIRGVLEHFLDILPEAKIFNNFSILVNKRFKELEIRGKELV